MAQTDEQATRVNEIEENGKEMKENERKWKKIETFSMCRIYCKLVELKKFEMTKNKTEMA